MRRFAALLAMVFAMACTNEIDTSTRPELIVGTYKLRAYGGRTLPTQTAFDQGVTTELLNGELVINTDKSWTETRTYRFTESGVAQEMSFGSAGSWAFLGEGADLQFNDKVLNYQFTGTAAGGSVTLNLNDGNTIIYAR